MKHLRVTTKSLFFHQKMLTFLRILLKESCKQSFWVSLRGGKVHGGIRLQIVEGNVDLKII